MKEKLQWYAVAGVLSFGLGFVSARLSKTRKEVKILNREVKELDINIRTLDRVIELNSAEQVIFEQDYIKARSQLQEQINQLKLNQNQKKK